MQTLSSPLWFAALGVFAGIVRVWRIAVAMVVSLLVLALVGCASTIEAKITRFNQWPTNAASQTFSFTPAKAGRELELRAYQALAARELQARGLVPATPDQPGHFVVDVTTTQTERSRTERVPVWADDWVYVPTWRDPTGRLYGGHWAPERFGSRYVGDREVTRTLQASELRLRISEQSTGGEWRTVFEATAVQESRSDDLAEVMPYLMQGVFQDFPGANGQVRRLRFELPRR